MMVRREIMEPRREMGKRSREGRKHLHCGMLTDRKQRFRDCSRTVHESCGLRDGLRRGGDTSSIPTKLDFFLYTSLFLY